MSQQASIEDRCRGIVCKHLGRTKDEVTAGAHLRDDLGADSLDGIELRMALEEEFNMAPRQGEQLELRLDRINTFGDMVRAVAGVLGEDVVTTA